MARKKKRRSRRTTRVPLGLLLAAGASAAIFNDPKASGQFTLFDTIRNEPNQIADRVTARLRDPETLVKTAAPLAGYAIISMITPTSVKRKLGISAGGVRVSVV